MVCCEYNKKWGFMFLATFFMTVAWVLSIFAIGTCNFVSVQKGVFANERGMGLYWFEDAINGECFFFDPTGVDWSQFPYWSGANMMAARICSAISLFFSTILIIIMWMGVCCGCCHGKCSRVAISVMMICIAALFCGIFAVFGSQSCDARGGCSISAGAICAICAVISYFIAALIACVSPPDHHNSGAKVAAPAAAASDEVNIKKVDNPDGSTTVKKSIMSPDGEEPSQLTSAVVGDEKV